ncbi:hypothetical protein [Sphingosinicella sp. YJ22]|uniref:hypothetical protein n=1 Tax=Sphingosinicella sp. YJ22 TaxID=1104780 RepID=UPI001408BA4B|nr:hypothetical protein [Sphingosinicella sp. YJ22]
MIGTNLVPRPWRRQLIDSVYGAEDDKGMRIYLGVLWGGFFLLALILLGFTPWAWPAQREAQVESLTPITCEAVLGDDEAADRAETNTSTNRSRSKSRAAERETSSRSACRAALTDAERAQLGRTEALVAYLQRGGVTPPPLNLEADSPVRAWVDNNICRLGGAGAGDRGALAWHVSQGAGECSGGNKLVARMPLSILLWPWLGALLTPLLLLWLGYRLVRHTLRLPATRRAYRRLYGSEHKAP